MSSVLDHRGARHGYVPASDYDRDTQALKDELDNIKRSWGLILSQRDALAAERSWSETELPKWRDLAKETRIERDELRAQVEAMRALLVDAHWTVHLPTTEHAIIPRCRCRKCVINRIDAALQEDKA